MGDTKSRKAKIVANLRAQPDEADVDSSTELDRAIIELDDRSVGPEAEINRLKSKVITVMEEISQLRNQNLKLAMDHDKLKTEFRELKLVLAKLEVKELRAMERVNSWMRSFKMLQEMVGKNDDDQNKRSL